MTATIGATHILCAIGNGTDQVWASARAGIARIGSSHVMDRSFDAISMGLVPEEVLGELTPEIEKLPLPSRARRMLRLASPALKAVGAGLGGQTVPIFLGLPALSLEEAPWMRHVPSYLQQLTGVAIDQDGSLTVRHGRAAALMALERAVEAVRADPRRSVIVGGVDSFLDLRLLATLDAEGRILGPRVMDGFIPGEGAGFFVLSGAEAPGPATDEPRIIINSVASTMDAGHRYGSEPAKGEGLALAVQQLRAGLDKPVGQVGSTFAGFNGENFDAKLWGVARLRHTDFFTAAMTIDHPADKFGDAGAAMGAILVAMASKALATGARQGPALVWAASDLEPRACAVLSVQ